MRKKRADSPPRVPHEDPRTEAQVRHVLSRYAAIRRTEDRLEDLRREQRALDEKIRSTAGYTGHMELVKQRERLTAERAALEEFISAAYREITGILEALGDTALYLGAI